MVDNSDALTQEIPVAPPPASTSRFGRFRAAVTSKVVVSKFRAMSPRARWLNLGLAVLVIVAIIAAVSVIGSPTTPVSVGRTATVARGAITASVTGSGNTSSSLSTPVSFQTSGTVTAVKVKAGDTVTLGQVLATIDPAGSKASLRTAQAQLDNAKAALAQAASGPTEVKKAQDQQAIATARQGIDNAGAAVTNAESQLALDTTSAATAIDNARTKLANDQASTETSVRSAQATLEADRVSQDNAVATAQRTRDACALGCDTQQEALDNAKATRDAVLEKDRLAVTAAEQSRTSTLAADEQAITTAEQNQANTLLKDNNAITTAKQQVVTAQGQLRTAELTAEANLKPSTPAQIAQAQSSVDSAQVQVDTARRTEGQTELTAPQAGVVLAVNGKVGESSGGSSASTATAGTGGAASAASASTTSAGSGFVVIANLSKLAVTANIAEADAARITLGQKATITFPATNVTTTGSVTQITPQSTVVNNVVLYPITISLDTAPPEVGVGATAGLAITTGTVSDVLVAPTSAITTLGNRHTATVRRATPDNGTVDAVVPVEIGLAGDSTTEITSGLQVGDVLVLPSPAPAAGGFPGPGGGG